MLGWCLVRFRKGGSSLKLTNSQLLTRMRTRDQTNVAPETCCLLFFASATVVISTMPDQAPDQAPIGELAHGGGFVVLTYRYQRCSPSTTKMGSFRSRKDSKSSGSGCWEVGEQRG